MYNKSDQFYEPHDPNVPRMCGCLGPGYGEPLCPCAMARAGLPMSVDHVAALERTKENMKGLEKFFEVNRKKKEEK